MKKLIYLAILAAGLVAIMAPQAYAEDEKFTVHGEVRFRGESQNNAQDFDDDTDDGGLYWPYRVRLAVEGHFTKNVSAWVEIQNADFAGQAGPFRTGQGFDGSEIELYQGNVTFDKLWSDSFSLRLGRQELVFGNELIFGDLDFYNGISHDGGLGMWDFKKVDVSVWYTRPSEGSYLFGDGGLPPDQVSIGAPVDGIDNIGGYATWQWKNDQIFDVYLAHLNFHGDTGLITPFSMDNVTTIGARYAHDSMDDGFIWNAEIALQVGDADVNTDGEFNEDNEGRVFEGWLGYNWKRGDKVHRIYGRYAQATGDDTTSGDANEGFVPLFGDFHNRTGRGDWFQLAANSTSLGGTTTAGGLDTWSLGYNGFYDDRHEFGVAYWSYSLEEDSGGPEDDLGDAVDIWYGFNYSRNVNFVVSYSQFSPGDFFTAGGGPDDEAHRLYGQARLRF